MDKPTANLARSGAYTHDIVVRWSDCDPARIAYTGRIPYFALDAIDAWWKAHVGADWFEMNIDQDVGTPFVHMSIDFRRPVTPRQLLNCSVRAIKLGESSIRFRVEGWQDGELCFEGEFVEVFVEAAAHRKRRIPADIRRKLEQIVG